MYDRYNFAYLRALGTRTALLLSGALLLAAVPAAAQPTRRPAAPSGRHTPLLIDLRHGPAGTAPSVAERATVLRDKLALTSADDLRPLRTETDELGYVHERLQPYYRGVKVEHATISLHERAGQIELLTGSYERPSSGAMASPTLTEATARQRAIAAIGARSYKWQNAAEEAALRTQLHDPAATYAPQGELVWVGDFRQPEATRPVVLAWKFNIYAQEPMSRDWVYIDAHSGQMISRDPIIKHAGATGTFATRYVGSRTAATDNFGSGFRLRETVHGKGVTTLNMHTRTAFATADDFVDNDNNWTAAEYDNAAFDNAALDAHLGAQITQDYWTNVHGRDSYDDRGSVLLSYVHFDVGFDNAFWNGSAMIYGDGLNLYKPMTSLDICGHEVGHAVCETTARLVYQDESGALNEGLSDIWGACIEHHFDPTMQNWLIGEDIMLSGPALRSMSDPNSQGQPDTYFGDNWATGPDDHGGVHTNSGVLNFWFYLLSVGGSGNNDFGIPYGVSGITMEKAARITYRAERLYMTPNETYVGARRATMQAAMDLYGLGSPEITSVANAWRAVGVDEDAPTITSFTPTSGTPGTVVTINGTNFGLAYTVSFNGTVATIGHYASSTQITATVPVGATTGKISLTSPTGTAISAANFTVNAAGAVPTITSFSPSVGQIQGGTVTLTGTNFTGATAVKFNGATATFTVVNATTISATVPTSATTGPLTVTTPSGIATAPTTFTVLPHITAFTPTSGVGGTTVVITGTSFTGATSVKFNGTYAASMVVNSATKITATVAVGSNTGPITVRTPNGTATSATSFTVNPTLSFNSFSPTSGPVGTVVTIRGIGFTGTSGVTFGGVPASTFTVASDMELWATVPSGAVTGDIVVTNPLGTATSPAPFGVVVAGGPSITSFSPAAGPAGTAVVITGLNFTGTTAVSFNGTAATFTLVNATTINATVPAGATSGPVGVTTTVSTGLSSTYFIVPPFNDVCSGSVPMLTCGSVVSGTTEGSTDIGDPTDACGGNTPSAAAGGVFYRLTGTGSSITVATCISSFDGLLYVYTGSCGAYVCVGSDDDGCGNKSGGSSVTFASTAGTPYYVFVSGYQALQGTFALSMSCAPGSDLVVSTTAPIASGTYRNITVTPTGVATLTAGVSYTGALTVQTGGVFDDGCQVLTGSGSFVLQTGATMRVCHPQGLATTGATGAVQVTGARSFASAATYVYTGTTAQATGLGLPLTVDQLSVENPTSVSLSRALSIRRQLTLAGVGNLVPNSFVLSLLSNATGTALVVNAGSGVVSGPATVQRYLTPGSATGLGYRHMSAPVINSTVGDLALTNAFTPVVNPAYNSAATPATVTPYPNIFGFDETRGGAAVTDFSRGYFSPDALSSALTSGRGYSVYMRPLTPDFVGTLGNGTITVAGLTHTGAGNVGGQKPGWHLLGNPYPAPIDWDLVTVPAGMDAGISVFQSTGGNNGLYLSRANGLGSLTDGLVAMGQGFFARVTGAGPVDFDFTNDYRVTSYANPSHFRAARDERPQVSLTVRAAGANETATDATTIYFEAGATPGTDAQFDAVKPGRNVGVPTVVSLGTNGAELAINGQSEAALAAGLTVELLVALPTAGRYELAVSDAQSLTSSTITLLDRLTNTRYDATTTPTVTVTTTGAEELRGRFALEFGATGSKATGATTLTVWPNPAQTTVSVALPIGAASVTTVTVLDATGRVVRTQALTPVAGGYAAAREVQLSLAGLPAGVYVVKAGAATARLVVE